MNPARYFPFFMAFKEKSWLYSCRPSLFLKTTPFDRSKIKTFLVLCKTKYLPYKDSLHKTLCNVLIIIIII